MKKSIVAVGALLFTSMLIAGGGVSTKVSEVKTIPSHDCRASMVYRDKEQHLLWQDEPYTEAENGAVKRGQSIGKAGSYMHAIRYCEHLHYGGYADWRLPTSDELTHLHDKSGQVFRYFRDNDFWSSTPATEGRYYVVFPADAMRYARSPRQSNYIRCVRCIVNAGHEDSASGKPPFRSR